MYWRPVGTAPGTPWVGGHVTDGSMGPSKRVVLCRRRGSPRLRDLLPGVQPDRDHARRRSELLHRVAGPGASPLRRATRWTPDNQCQRRAREHRRDGRVPVRHRPVRRGAVDLLGRGTRRGHQHHRRNERRAALGSGRRRGGKQLRHLPAARQPVRQRRPRSTSASRSRATARSRCRHRCARWCRATAG